MELIFCGKRVARAILVVYKYCPYFRGFVSSTAFGASYIVRPNDLFTSAIYAVCTLNPYFLSINNIVSGYFDFAEIQAMRHNPMYMSDYVEHLDNVLKTTGEKLLQGAGTISHAQARLFQFLYRIRSIIHRQS